MTGPLLTTKWHLPRRRRGLLRRPRVVERLAGADDAALTLVSAPAGFGKTTLLTEWLADWRTADPARAVAWLSLDERDDDPVVFWAYVASALGAAGGSVGGQALALAHERHSAVDDVVATLVNELAAVEGDLVLVLDDYHVVAAPAVHDGVAHLVEHLPAQVHLVVSTRADPPLPLARWRSRGELVEVRADDLRFTTQETGAYLAEVTGLVLPAEQVDALDARTEGWAAALQMAALSMRGRQDVAGFVTAFAGDDRWVVDYLAEEVLQRQPEGVRTFLLRTSVLSRMCGPLCDAVLGRDDGAATLQALDRANLFVVPLDDRRHWYRYHHLFAEVLHGRLVAEQPDAVLDLHRRASDWYAEHGEASEAIRHSLAAGDPGRAADLVEVAMPAARRNRQETTLRHWFTQLPEEVLRTRPVLRAGYAGVLLVHGELAGVEEHLRDAERWLRDQGPDRDEDLVRTVRGQVAVYRAAQARMSGDVAGTVEHARDVLELSADDDHLVRGSAAGLLGLASWHEGDLDAAERWWAEARDRLARAGHASDTLGVALALADISTARGRLGEAMAAYERGMATAAAHGPTVLRGTADMHVGIAEVLRERGDLEAARRHLAAAADLGDGAGLPQNRHRRRVAAARLRQAEGDLDGAERLLGEAEQAYVADMFPDVRPVAALRARVWLAQGRADLVLAWARERGLSLGAEPTFLGECELLTLARAVLATAAGGSATASRATALLQRLLDAAEDGGRTGNLIEVLVAQALARRAGGDDGGAVEALQRALALAEPEGYVRTFADEGPPMAALLGAVARRQRGDGYTRRLLAAVRGDEALPARPAGLVEPLSVRETDVLRLLAGDLDGPAIARELFLSLNTVRTHTRRIYEKLGVTSRRAAVRRATDLGLLARGARG